MKESGLPGSLDELLFVVGLGALPGKILIVEDERFVRESLQHALLSRGHFLDALVGVERDWTPAVAYDVAFLDGYFLSSSMTGATLAPILRKLIPPIKIVGISSDPGMNARMEPDLALPKSTLRRLL